MQKPGGPEDSEWHFQGIGQGKCGETCHVETPLLLHFICSGASNRETTNPVPVWKTPECQENLVDNLRDSIVEIIIDL